MKDKDTDPLSRSLYPVLIASVLLFLSPQLMQAQFYVQHNLVSNSSSIPANTIDPNLVNPWGMVQAPTSPFWVSNQGTNTSTLYLGNGSLVKLGTISAVKIPTVPPVNGFPPNGPTGVVVNDGSGFTIPTATGTTRSIFIFANLNGEISGWNPGSTGGVANAVVAVNNSSTTPPPVAVYTGLAINGTGSLLYAANFNAGGGIQAFNNDWTKNTTLSFNDPDLPSGYEPYNVKDMNGTLFVAYAPIGKDGLPVIGSGNGAIAEFTDGTNGTATFIKQLINSGAGDGLNVPWGMTMAPGNWGKFGGDLLVGNFGSGWISAYDPASGNFLGYLESGPGTPITDVSMWTLAFGTGKAGSSSNVLYITAGVDPQQNMGVLAAIQPTPEPATLALFGGGLLLLGFLVHRHRHLR